MKRRNTKVKSGARGQWLRKRALEDWRGLPEVADTSARTKALSEVVPELLRGLGLKERFDEEEMIQAWREMVGDFLAEHSRPVTIKRKVLVVRVLQPTLHYDLERSMKPQLLRKIQDRFGSDKVVDIRFTLG